MAEQGNNSPAPASASPAASQGAPAQAGAQGNAPPAPVGQPAKDGQGGSLLAGDPKLKEGGEGKPQGAPERYELKAPQGLDPELQSAFEGTFKKLNLTNEAAQQLLDGVVPQWRDRQQKQIEAAREGWVKEVIADKEIGGDKLDASLSVARKVLEKFGSPELNKLIGPFEKGGGGLGDRLEFIKLLVKIGGAMSEDHIVTGSASTGQPQGTDFASIAARLYGGDKNKK